MSQTWTVSQNDSAAKSLDFAFVIAGWPTIYTIAKSDYTRAGIFANFTATKVWASVPVSPTGQAVKGRPEEGGMTIGEMEVSILDRSSGGSREMTDLLSREAYLRGPAGSSGTATTLNGPLSNDPTITTITVGSVGGFSSSGGFAYVGLECIKYTGTSGNTLTGCTRGALMTSCTPHLTGSFIYSFMPSLFRRKAFLYKGYQDLALESWAPAFGGVIAGVQKQGPAVVFRVMSTTWNTWSDGRSVCFKWATDAPGLVPITEDALPLDFSVLADIAEATSNIGNGHYLINIGGSWNGITGIT